MILRSDPALLVTVDFVSAPNDRQSSLSVDAADAALVALENFKPNAEHIRKAISNPNDMDIALACAKALIPNVGTIAGWMTLAGDVAKEIERLCESLANTTAAPEPPAISSDPASTTALLKLIHFCWKFDQGKLLKPGVQNDFSGYRRVVGKVPADTVGLSIGESETNTISMWSTCFFAIHLLMLFVCFVPEAKI